MGSTKEKKVTKEEVGSLKLEELSDVDILYAVRKWLHTPAFTGSKGVAFADSALQTGWRIDLKISSPYGVTKKDISFGKL